MTPTKTIRDLYEKFVTELELRWDGEGDVRLDVEGDTEHEPNIPMVGPFNMIRPNRIQIIGPPEQKHLKSLGEPGHQNCLESLFSTQPAAIIFTDNLSPTSDCAALAKKTRTALIKTAQPDYRIISHLLAHFSKLSNESILLHGVFMEVLGKGVLLTGMPAAGKRELALELVSRGHRLVADDATEFMRLDQQTLNGRCPPVLQDFLEVRGLGVLNIRAMFGNSAIKPKKVSHLIIDLQPLEQISHKIDRLHGNQSNSDILGVTVPKTTIPVAPGRNLAIQVETAVRQHLLHIEGYDAADDFTRRQREHIDHPHD
ncbi:MAG: HPr(Ser) kinase/phosphatase [Gammaproteobacteria bacterium]|nr:HPr(Ser) kinase/phosphatase [Gammaproteobacteria bacterium]